MGPQYGVIICKLEPPKAMKPPHLFSFINGLSDEFLYGNIKPTDTYASDSAFSHEMKSQFLDGSHHDLYLRVVIFVRN